MMYPGFLPVDQGQILSNAMFSAADLTKEGYSQLEMNWMKVPFILSVVHKDTSYYLFVVPTLRQTNSISS